MSIYWIAIVLHQKEDAMNLHHIYGSIPKGLRTLHSSVQFGRVHLYGILDSFVFHLKLTWAETVSRSLRWIHSSFALCWQVTMASTGSRVEYVGGQIKAMWFTTGKSAHRYIGALTQKGAAINISVYKAFCCCRDHFWQNHPDCLCVTTRIQSLTRHFKEKTTSHLWANNNIPVRRERQMCSSRAVRSFICEQRGSLTKYPNMGIQWKRQED